jgi:chromosomal replication initiator protein
VIDHITEIPLAGRMMAPPVTDADGSVAAGVALPSFVAGPENRLVAATFGRLLEGAAAPPDASRVWNGFPTLLALFGSAGTGKTHLCRGLVRYWQARRGEQTAAYLTAQDFRRQLTDAAKNRAVQEFRGRVRACELLAIDDLQQLPGDAYVLQDLRYTLDTLDELGHVVMVASDRPVSALPNIPVDLRGRFSSGLTLQLASPGTAARMRIVRHMSAALARPLSEEAIRSLAGGMNGTANQLVGTLYQLYASLPAAHAGSAVDVDRLVAIHAERRLELSDIIRLVARYYGLSQKRLKSGSRKRSIVLARATIAYLARELTDASYEQIGRALGGRDHTTIMHSYKRLQRDTQSDLLTQQTIDDLRRILIGH